MSDEHKEVSVSVPMNIALIKYWGKRDEDLILPLNDSISLTVNNLMAETTVRMIEGTGQNTVEINGSPGINKRYNSVFHEALRLLRKRKEDTDSPCFHFEISSTTNFPVAAGLASSAAGFGAIAMGLKHLLNLDDTAANRLARMGSGSACRSMYPGLVQWKRGEKKDGSDCVAVRVDSANWEELYCVILVFDDRQKKVGSSEGMRRSCKTSTLLKHRVEHVVPERIERIKKAYEARNFEELAEITMADSNQFHAICLDSSPPINYLNELSWNLIRLVDEFNTDQIRAAYTFDAGPNACVIVQRKDIIELIEYISKAIVIDVEDVKEAERELDETLNAPTASTNFKCSKMIVSKMGGGPSTKN